LNFAAAGTQGVVQLYLHAGIGNQVINLFFFTVLYNINAFYLVAIGKRFIVKTTAFNRAGSFAARIRLINILFNLQP